jgi:hypothetical protein
MNETSEVTQMQTPSPSRFRFTLRTVFVLMAVVGGVLAVFIPYTGCLGLFFALLIVAAGWSYLRGNTKGAVGCLVVLGVLWLALQLFGPYTSLRNRVIFVVGTERLQQWAIETLDHPPPVDKNGNILLEANDLPEDIRTLTGFYNVVWLSEDGSHDCILFGHDSGFYRWGIVVARPGCNPSFNRSRERIADGIWGYECRSGLVSLARFHTIEFFVSPDDFQWTMGHTHEDHGFGGPYFLDRDWIPSNGNTA